MSIRRKIGDIVLVKTEDEEFVGQIDGLGVEQQDCCSTCYVDPTHDSECREWPNVKVLNDEHIATGEWAYHVPECEMFDVK